jgi:hypothetical protein
VCKLSPQSHVSAPDKEAQMSDKIQSISDNDLDNAIISEAEIVNESIEIIRDVENKVGIPEDRLIKLRDLLLRIRMEHVYCCACHCPSWSPDRSDHYATPERCQLGDFLEELLTAYPKEGVSVKWRY